jgi:hypothetical protein
MLSYQVPLVHRDRGELRWRHISGSFVATLFGAMRMTLVSSDRKHCGIWPGKEQYCGCVVHSQAQCTCDSQRSLEKAIFRKSMQGTVP